MSELLVTCLLLHIITSLLLLLHKQLPPTITSSRPKSPITLFILLYYLLTLTAKRSFILYASPFLVINTCAFSCLLLVFDLHALIKVWRNIHVLNSRWELLQNWPPYYKKSTVQVTRLLRLSVTQATILNSTILWYTYSLEQIHLGHFFPSNISFSS